jgi:hypothetical protein
MSSIKLRIFPAVWRGLIFTFFISAASASDMNIPIEFPTVPAIDAWAKTTYLGFEKYSFSRRGKTVVVVIGSATSGLPTSEIVVFNKREDGTYALVLVRRRLYGIVKVEETDDALVFSARTPILIVPWTGVVLDMEQMR